MLGELSAGGPSPAGSPFLGRRPFSRSDMAAVRGATSGAPGSWSSVFHIWIGVQVIKKATGKGSVIQPKYEPPGIPKTPSGGPR